MNLATVESVLLALLVVDAIALTVLVLLQQGKGADVGAAFGSGSASTMFGSLGAATFFTKATAWLAIGFFLITFGLAYLAKERAAAAGTLGIPTVNSSPATDVGEDSDAGALPDTDLPEGDVPSSGAAIEENLDVPDDIPALGREIQDAVEQTVEDVSDDVPGS